MDKILKINKIRAFDRLNNMFFKIQLNIVMTYDQINKLILN